MKAYQTLTGGLAGAVVLTAIHELLRKNDPDAPRLDMLGMNALAKSLASIDETVPEKKKLFGITLAGDIAGNMLFYSLAGIGSRKWLIQRAIGIGLIEGMGAIYLPDRLDLNAATTNKTTKTRLLTVGLYMTSALVAAFVMQLLDQKTDTKIPNSGQL